jgi:hypothetical protein
LKSARPRPAVSSICARSLKPLQICRDLAPAIAIVEKAAPNFNRNIHGELMRPHTELEGAARELAAVLPNSDVVEAALGEINRALTEPCDPDIARVLVGALLAGFGVRPGEDAEIRLAAMTLAVEDISEDESGTPAASAAVLAAATVSAWRRGGAFAPSPGELLKLCREHHARLKVRRRGVLELIQARYDVEEVLEEIEF